MLLLFIYYSIMIYQYQKRTYISCADIVEEYINRSYCLMVGDIIDSDLKLLILIL